MIQIIPNHKRHFSDFGWLKTYWLFSFSNYYDPSNIQFGALRVFNDDVVEPKTGFPTHPHEEMEIVTIVLSGEITHKDSMGNGTTIKSGDIQVMSAGTGIQHSEFNPNPDQHTKLFQIWLFPKYHNVTPRYQQITLDKSLEKNDFAQILSPNPEDAGVWIHQDAWFYLSDFDADFSKKLSLKKEGNGFYIMNIEGEIEVNGQKLEKRDAVGIWETNEIEIKANSNAKFLVMEIPMEQ